MTMTQTEQPASIAAEDLLTEVTIVRTVSITVPVHPRGRAASQAAQDAEVFGISRHSYVPGDLVPEAADYMDAELRDALAVLRAKGFTVEVGE